MKREFIPWVFTFCALTTGCLSSGDPYSFIEPACSELLPTTSSGLSQECKDALNEVLPFDQASFDSAPMGMKDKVLEAFQALSAFPFYLAPDQNSVFGLRNSSLVGPITLRHFEILGSETLLTPPRQRHDFRALNRAVFNYVVNKITVIRFQASGAAVETLASYSNTTDGGLGTLSITPSFWSSDQLYSTFFRAPLRAAVLLHEARHGDGIFHVPCTSDPSEGGFFCDADYNGPYGVQIAYLLAVLRTGSAPLSDYRSGAPILDSLDQAFISAEICSIAQFAINRPLLGLERMIENGDCYETPVENFLKAESIPIVPTQPEAFISLLGLKSGAHSSSVSTDYPHFQKVNDIARWLGKTPQELGLPYLRSQHQHE